MKSFINKIVAIILISSMLLINNVYATQVGSLTGDNSGINVGTVDDESEYGDSYADVVNEQASAFEYKEVEQPEVNEYNPPAIGASYNTDELALILEDNEWLIGDDEEESFIEVGEEETGVEEGWDIVEEEDDDDDKSYINTGVWKYGIQNLSDKAGILGAKLIVYYTDVELLDRITIYQLVGDSKAWGIYR